MKLKFKTKQSRLILAAGLFLFILILAMVIDIGPAKLKYLRNLLNYKVLQTGQVAGMTTKQLPVTWHHQEHTLSCEIAALKIALTVYGLDIPESQLIDKLNFDNTTRTATTWGDPNIGFVGSIDGKMMADGYGVYAQPIADVANQYLRAKIIQATPQELTKQIDAGRPVVIWGYFGRGRTVEWTTPEQKTIVGVNGEHARTVTGYTGSADSPSGFIIQDPIFGQFYWKTAYLIANQKPFDSMGVVVYSPFDLTGSN